MAEWSILCHVHFTTIQKSRNSSTHPGAPPARDPHTKTTEGLRAFQRKSVSQASNGTRPEGPHAAGPGDRCVKSGLFIHCKHHSRQWENSRFQWLGRLSRRAPVSPKLRAEEPEVRAAGGERPLDRSLTRQHALPVASSWKQGVEDRPLRLAWVTLLFRAPESAQDSS